MPGSESSGTLGDLALVLYAEGDPEAAHVLGFLHNDVDRPPGAQAGQHVLKHNPTKVTQTLDKTGHSFEAPKLAWQSSAQTHSVTTVDDVGDQSAHITHTAENNISHTAQKGDISHTATKGNISHVATKGNIVHSAPNGTISLSALGGSTISSTGGLTFNGGGIFNGGLTVNGGGNLT